MNIITSPHSLEHIPDFMGILRQVLPLLKKDGILCIETPNQESLVRRILGYKVRSDRFLGDLYPPTHIHAFCRRSYQAIAQMLDAQIIQCLTYSPGDPNWFSPLTYRRSGLVPLLQNLSAYIGMGLNIAVFLKYHSESN